MTPFNKYATVLRLKTEFSTSSAGSPQATHFYTLQKKDVHPTKDERQKTNLTDINQLHSATSGPLRSAR